MSDKDKKETIFFSTSKRLRIGNWIKEKRMANGDIVSGEDIEFENWQLRTTDKKMVEFLKATPEYLTRKKLFIVESEEELQKLIVKRLPVIRDMKSSTPSPSEPSPQAKTADEVFN